MSTRATIRITDETGTVDLYRHYDGYPAGAGRSLARALDCWHWAEAARIATVLIRDGEHELTTRCEAHADREYHYDVTIRDGRIGLVEVYHRPIGGELRPVFSGTLPEYRRYVAQEIRRLRERLRIRRQIAQQPPAGRYWTKVATA